MILYECQLQQRGKIRFKQIISAIGDFAQKLDSEDVNRRKTIPEEVIRQD